MNHQMRQVPSPTPKTRQRRCGVAATEFAVCLPVLLIIVFGSIESCTMIFLKQSLTVAAYEGVRVAIEQGDNANVTAAGNQVLTDRKISGGTIETTPADISTAPIGSYVTVRVIAPCDSNSALRGWFFANTNVVGEATMMKEF